MVKIIRSFVAAVALLTFFSTVCASEKFNFSYTFGDGSQVDGSFDGTASGNLITGLSSIFVNFNGVAFNGSGALFGAGKPQASSNWAPGLAVASFDGLENNFLFVDSKIRLINNLTNYFSASSHWMPGDKHGTEVYRVADQIYHVDIDGGSALQVPGYSDYSNSRWSVVSAVPEPETNALMLVGLCLVGVVARRGKKRLVA